jgi:hypothetical protein
MQLTEGQGTQNIQFWSAEEELIISTIQEAESVPQAEAIRRMQRRKTASRPRTDMPAPTTQRLCRNPRCTRGDECGPGSLAHLRADALYCNATCKKAVQRSSNRQNQASNRQCLSGSRRGQFSSLRSPSGAAFYRRARLIAEVETEAVDATFCKSPLTGARARVSYPLTVTSAA